MSGRFTLRTPPSVLVEHFRLKSVPALTPRYKVAPKQQVGIVRRIEGDQREFNWMQWTRSSPTFVREDFGERAQLIRLIRLCSTLQRIDQPRLAALLSNDVENELLAVRPP
jgi:putative SOS response-associated peptidase YedK